MGIFERFKGKPRKSEKLPPMNGGRQSEVDSDYSLSSLVQELSLIKPDFHFELIKVLEHLAMYNHDVSFAVENIVTLGNTDFSISFEDKVPDKVQKEALDNLKQFRNNWYPNSDGINALINDLFVQVAVTGALSSEIIPTNNLDSVKKVVLLSPSKIRFNYDKKVDEYLPFQVSSKNTLKNLIPLNPFTYRYSALRRMSQKPYGIPPFLSALENIAIEKSMVDDLKHVTKKLGVLGFLKVLINAPARKPGEGDEAWAKRCRSYLQESVPEVEKSAKKGFVLGFKGTHEFEMENVSTNVQGAKELFQLNTEMKMSGLKQDPMMLGRNYSTTETLGRVILAKLGTQIENYQKIIESYLEYLFKLHLQLQGFKINFLEVTFEKPLIGDKGREEEAESKKIDNADKLYQQGVISQVQRAQMLGYEKPDQEMPRSQTQQNPEGDSKKSDDPSGDEDPTDGKTTESNWRGFLGFRKYDPYYEHQCTDSSCSCGSKLSGTKALEELAKPKNDFEKLLKGYLQNTLGIYSDAIDSSVTKIGRELAALGDGVTLERINDVVIYHLYNGWNKRFTEKQLKITKDNVTHIYDRFRRDKSIFEKFKGDVPDAVFNVTDVRAQEYFKNSDQLYLGQFITDPDTRKKITDFIKEEYIENNLPIGSNKDPKSLEKFREKFKTVLEGEDWKITRILNTTVNKMRNYAAVNYMSQAEIHYFEIVGIPDRLQCEYCASVQGFEFSVEIALKKVEQEVQSSPDFVKANSPFINSIYKKPADLEGVAAKELQAQGIDTPPFHPHCRDRILAVFSEVIDT